MQAFVIDTNVAIVANRGASQALKECTLVCVDFLSRIQRESMIVLDSRMLILSEYMKHLSPSGQPGVGDAFFKWVWQNQANVSRCERVDIHSKPGDEFDFEEFPTIPELADFDRSDRKFVAVALTSRNNPSIVNAVDSDWWDYRFHFKELGLKIEFICPEIFQDRA